VSRSTRIWIAIAAALLLLPFAPWAAHAALGHTPSGLRVDGRALPASREPRVLLAQRADRWLDARVRVAVGDVVRRRSRRELGARIDLDALTRRAASLGRSGRPWRDLPDLWSAWTGDADLAWTLSIDEHTARAFVREIAREADHPPRPALVDSDGQPIELSADGLRVNRAQAMRALSRTLREGRRAVLLPSRRLSSGVGARALSPVLHPDARPIVVARYSTRYRTRGTERARAHNVETAARYLDGAVIAAHGRFSFNERVGARDRAHGYREAHVIVGGEMVDGIGGGVCQVASTLHAAAFLAGLAIVEHQPHSRPSEYIAMGLDATVVWPTIDLVISNPFPFPLTVRARAEGGEIYVELYGRRRLRRVDWEHHVLATSPFSDRYVEDPLVPPGEQRVSQRGIRGFWVARERSIEDERGVHIEERRLHYPPTDRIVRVAPGSLDPETLEPRSPEALPDNPYGTSVP
jgi:vancomycin resistance protein YoaR